MCIQGVRQIVKITAGREFGKTEYNCFIEFNFIPDAYARAAFDGNHDTDTIIEKLCNPHDIGMVLSIHQKLLDLYHLDVLQHTNPKDRPKLRAVFDSMPVQLNDKNGTSLSIPCTRSPDWSAMPTVSTGW